MDFIENFHFWRDDLFFDEHTRSELSKLNEETDLKEIEDRFYKELEFGTAGLRGVMGAGTNRMNQYTIGKATAGYAKYLLKYYTEDECKNNGVVISYDTRNNSHFFAVTTARIFSGYGIKVLLFANPSPIPVLSYAIRRKRAIGGVMITASHNTKEYNGYKVYDNNGCQLGVKESNIVTRQVNKIQSYKEIDFDGNIDLIETTDVTDNYVTEILNLGKLNDKKIKSNLNIVYTPIHGCGLVPVCKTLERAGFNSVSVVEGQREPDGEFPTVESPNPAHIEALEMAINQAKQFNSDIVIGTDPDSDRVGVVVKHENDYAQISGNEIGALIVDYVLRNEDLKKLKNPAIIKSIVSSNLSKKIADKMGVFTFETLTGFKFIGERITEFKQARKQGDSLRDYYFLVGFEESCGYLVGTHARDKDAVVSTLLVCEIAAELKAQNKTLIDRLYELYDEFGYYYDYQESVVLCGKENTEKIKKIMDNLRNNNSPFENTEQVVDYLKPTKAEKGFGYYPLSNVLIFKLKCGSWIAVRPSGTEPKIKFYFSIIDKDKTSAKNKFLEIQKTLMDAIDLRNL